MSHPELGSLGGEIIATIMDIADERKQRSHNSTVGMLPELFDKVLHFVENVLSTRGPHNNMTYWAEQTYKIIQKLERTPLPGWSLALSAVTTVTLTPTRM